MAAFFDFIQKQTDGANNANQQNQSSSGQVPQQQTGAISRAEDGSGLAASLLHSLASNPILDTQSIPQTFSTESITPSKEAPLTPIHPWSEGHFAIFIKQTTNMCLPSLGWFSTLTDIVFHSFIQHCVDFLSSSSSCIDSFSLEF